MGKWSSDILLAVFRAGREFNQKHGLTDKVSAVSAGSGMVFSLAVYQSVGFEHAVHGGSCRAGRPSFGIAFAQQGKHTAWTAFRLFTSFRSDDAWDILAIVTYNALAA